MATLEELKAGLKLDLAGEMAKTFNNISDDFE